MESQNSTRLTKKPAACHNPELGKFALKRDLRFSRRLVQLWLSSEFVASCGVVDVGHGSEALAAAIIRAF